MAVAVKPSAAGGAAALHLFRNSHNPFPCHVSFRNLNVETKPPCFTVFAVVKRSPKRLKYSAPRFRKADGLVYVEVDPSGSDSWKLDPIVELLKEGAVGVIPTDTVYAIVCNLKSQSTIERLRRIKNVEASKSLSILCFSFRDIDTYTTGFSRGNDQGFTNIFRAVKHCLPGPLYPMALWFLLFTCSVLVLNPCNMEKELYYFLQQYTFILSASKELPRQCTRYGTTASKFVGRKNVGVRIPDDPICQAILD